MKRCSRCKEEKDESEFYKHATGKDGLRSMCKVCMRAYEIRNKERIAETKHKYNQKNMKKILDRNKDYLKSKPSSYISWLHMRQRCSNPNRDNYKYYGGRGITICKRWWDSYDKFCEDMGPRPEGTTIDRIDNDGNYEPSNCRWATPAQQNRNRSISLNFGGEVNANDLPIGKSGRSDGDINRSIRTGLQDVRREQPQHVG